MIVDLDLPDSCGLDTLRRIMEGRPTVPVVVLTGHDDNIAGQATVQAGAQDFLIKGRVNEDGLSRAITYAIERKKAEQALRESEERFRGLYENATIGMYRTTPDGRILMANSALLRMLGYATLEDLARRDLKEEGYGSGYARSDFETHIQQMGEVIGFESAWKRKDGSTVYIRESARLVHDEAGSPLYYNGTVEDISERKSVEEALRRQTVELRERNSELERFNRVAVGRELAMMALKKEVNDLSLRLGETPRYRIPEDPPDSARSSL